MLQNLDVQDLYSGDASPTLRERFKKLRPAELTDDLKKGRTEGLLRSSNDP